MPLIILSSIDPLLQHTPGSEAIAFLVSISAIVILFIGYGFCWIAANRYVLYKGYENTLKIYSILNIFGLAILFLRKGNNTISNVKKKHPSILLPANVREIRNATIIGVACMVIFTFFSQIFASRLENYSESIRTAGSLYGLFLLCYGLFAFAVAANKYAAYKGYKNYLYVYSLLNVFGLSILFLLKNKNQSRIVKSGIHPLNQFSISSVFLAYCSVSVVCTSIVALIALSIAGSKEFEEYFIENVNLSNIYTIFIEIIFVWYVFKEFKRAKLNHKFIIGSLREINFKLPIGLAIIKYLFAWGINPITLYGLSFAFPIYVGNQINKEYATSFYGWICFAIGVLIFAPIIEEILFMGVFFQKLAFTKDSNQAIFISAIAFSVMHFRYDIVPLFITGIIYVILYQKTKQLAVPIACHFFYNLIVTAVNLYEQLFSNTDPSTQITIVEYQQQFSDRLGLYILFLAISTPYLCCFIYKNFPRNYRVEQLPYFANQQDRLSNLES